MLSSSNVTAFFLFYFRVFPIELGSEGISAEARLRPVVLMGSDAGLWTIPLWGVVTVVEAFS